MTINEQEIKISQCADDTTLILDGSTVSFTTFFTDIRPF